MHNTLKDRIKRSMEPAAPSSSSSGRHPTRRASLLDAASALASLGGDALTASLGLLRGTGGAPALAPTARTLYTNEGTMQPKAGNDGGGRYREVSLDSMMLSRRQHQQPSLALPSSSLRGDLPMTFPEKLMEVLDNEEISDVITWLPHGKVSIDVYSYLWCSQTCLILCTLFILFQIYSTLYHRDLSYFRNASLHPRSCPCTSSSPSLRALPGS